VGAAITQAESGDAVTGVGNDGVVHGGEGLLGVDRVVAESLDAQEASVGGEADLAQGGQVGQFFPIPKSRVLLIVVSVCSAFSCL
jgi:hypothetical protein